MEPNMTNRPKPKETQKPKFPDPGPKPVPPESVTIRWWQDLEKLEDL
jgi:hypothetical protein